MRREYITTSYRIRIFFKKNGVISIVLSYLLNFYYSNHSFQMYFQVLPLIGLEPTIPGLGGRCLIHKATEAL